MAPKKRGPGVYCIRNRKNGKRYVGSSSSNISARWWLHKKSLRKSTHHSVHLQRAWNKYGEEAFAFEVIEKCSPDDCIIREQYWMDYYNAASQQGYNTSPTAGSCRGYRWSPEMRARLKEVRKRTVLSDEARARISAAASAYRGWKMSDEQKEKLRKANLGKRYPEEVNKKKGSKGPKSAAHARAIRKATRSPENRDRTRLQWLGTKKSEETKAKIAAAVAELWAERRRLGIVMRRDPITGRLAKGRLRRRNGTSPQKGKGATDYPDQR